MATLTLTRDRVSQVPTDRPESGVWAHPITGQRMSAWTPARSSRETDRRDSVLSGRLATSGLGIAGRAYAREMVETGDCGYRAAVKQAREIFRAE